MNLISSSMLYFFFFKRVILYIDLGSSRSWNGMEWHIVYGADAHSMSVFDFLFESVSRDANWTGIVRWEEKQT